MDYRYLIIRKADLAMMRVDTLHKEDFEYFNQGVTYIVDLATTTEYTKSGKWKSIKNGRQLKNKKS